MILYFQEAFDKLKKVYCDKKEFIEKQAQEQVEYVSFHVRNNSHRRVYNMLTNYKLKFASLLFVEQGCNIKIEGISTPRYYNLIIHCVLSGKF